MASDTFTIGFVGVGRMGANMARHLHDSGYTITSVYDIDASIGQELARELDCTAVDTPAHVAASSDTVITVVTDDEAMNTIYSDTSPESLLSYAEGRLFINCATTSPHVHREVEARVEKRGGGES